MIDISKVLAKNMIEAIEILKGKEDCTILFSEWDSENDEYADADNCPWIRYSNPDGEIIPYMIVAVRYNKEKGRIEVISTEESYEKSDEEWFPLSWADDISEWTVYDRIGECENS